MARNLPTQTLQPIGLGDTRGAVMVEYVVLLTLVSIVAVLATVALGVPLVNWYALQRIFMLVPVP